MELARVYGLHPVAQPLRLDYMGLKSAAPSFAELIAAQPATATVGECVIEFEFSAGSTMRIQWKNSSAPDWASLLRAWREAER